MASGGHSPLVSATSSLSRSRSSVDPQLPQGSSASSLALTGSSGTVSSLATHNGDYRSGRTPTRTKTMRTKDIEKSPEPHRFHLVPHGQFSSPSVVSKARPPSPQANRNHYRAETDSPFPRRIISSLADSDVGIIGFTHICR